MRNIKIAIIGGGASGLFASALLNDCEAEIFLLEKNNKLGKKILASGNGKCNFTNLGSFCDKYNDSFANLIINKFDVSMTLSEFAQMGLIYKADEQGRCYPISECASSVLDCLKLKMDKIKVLLDTTVDSVCEKGSSMCLSYNGKNECFDYVICCSGNNASNQGNDKAYSYLNDLDIKFKKTSASLAPIKVKENVKKLIGVRVKCIVNLLDENQTNIYSECGEVLFKDDGLSGIAIFNVSSIINRKKGNYKISLDLSNNMSDEKLKNYLKGKSNKILFKGFLNDKIAEYICEKCKLNNDEKLNENQMNNVIKNIKSMMFSVVDIYPLKDGQVASGGVFISEVDENLKLHKYPNVYIAGELLDIDGMCGGYNLQFAWSSAGVIANDIKRRINSINEDK